MVTRPDHAEARASVAFSGNLIGCSGEKLFSWLNNAELLKQDQRSYEYPVFDDSTVSQPVDDDHRKINLISRRLNSRPLALVCSGYRAMRNHSIVFGYHLLDPEIEVRKSYKPATDFLLNRFSRSRNAAWFGFRSKLMANAFRIKQLDRKSTRLNSSHRCISYAVFCLKKK